MLSGFTPRPTRSAIRVPSTTRPRSAPSAKIASGSLIHVRTAPPSPTARAGSIGRRRTRACQPGRWLVFSGGNEAVAQHDLFKPRRIRLAGTAHGLRDLLEIGAADASGIEHEEGARRLP